MSLTPRLQKHLEPAVSVFRPFQALLATAALLAMAGAARAEGAPAAAAPLPYDRLPTSTADTPVLDRIHRGYEPVGESLGSFTLYPGISLSEVFNDNLYAASDKAVGDFQTRLDPTLSLVSNWSQNMVRLDLLGHVQRYFDRPHESVNDGEINLSGRYDAPDFWTVSGFANVGHETEPRANTESPRDLESPIQYNEAHLQGQIVKPIDRLRLSLTTDFYRTAFEDGRTPAGQVVPQSIFNSQEVFVTGNLAYVINPLTSLVLNATGNARFFDHDQPQPSPLAALDQDSKGYDITAGINADVTHVLRAQVLVGYLRQTYSDSRVFQPVAGPSAHVKLIYLPTGLTTVSMTVERRVADAQDPNASSFIATQGHLQLDHELYRNIIVSAAFDYADDRYKGVDRDDRIASGHLSVSYLIDHNLSASLAFDHIYVASSGLARISGYNINQLGFTIKAQY